MWVLSCKINLGLFVKFFASLGIPSQCSVNLNYTVMKNLGPKILFANIDIFILLVSPLVQQKFKRISMGTICQCLLNTHFENICIK